jgi:transcriptional regulator with XRE-family HTH domain
VEEFAAALGARLRSVRAGRGLSLDALASASGVSRSMISDVERGTKVPTVLVLARLATALGTTVSHLIGEDAPAPVVLLRREAQSAIVDRAGWERRILSPALPGLEFEFIRTTVPAGVEIGSFPAHAAGAREWVAVERGTLTVTLDGVAYELMAGDSLYYAGDVPHAYANHGTEECVYYTAMEVP